MVEMKRFQLSILLASMLIAQRLGAQALPSLPEVYRGDCPFECCQLGNWTARESLQLYRKERGTGKPMAILRPGQSFTADSADFYTLDWGIISVRRPMRLVDELSPEADNESIQADQRGARVLARQLMPGDTIIHIGHVPEAGEIVWLDGVQAVASWFWADREEDLKDFDAPAVVVRPIRQEWWVRIRTPTGQTGWIQAWKKQIEGRDACG
jgi:hypothetical protein